MWNFIMIHETFFQPFDSVAGQGTASRKEESILGINPSRGESLLLLEWKEFNGITFLQSGGLVSLGDENIFRAHLQLQGLSGQTLSISH